MREIRCIVTDDEPIARKGLCGYVEKVPFLKLAGTCEDALQLSVMLKSERPDLLFLDIEMPFVSGIDFLSGITDAPQVIITTAYEQYAIKGYELDVADYLLKPISFERFLQSVNKVYARIDAQIPDEEGYIFVKSNGLLKKLFFDDILFIEGLENYVLVYTVSSKEVVHVTLKNLSLSLPEERFLQVHRSYIVNKKKVDAIEGNMVCIGEKRISVSRSFRASVFASLLGNHLL